MLSLGQSRYSLTILVFMFLTSLAMAGEPRGYRTVPVGLNLFEVIYGNIEGNTSFDGTLVSPDINVNINGTFLRYAHYFDLGGRLSAVGLMVPYGSQELSAHGPQQQMSLGSTTGMGDPSLIIGSSIFGGPALTLDKLTQLATLMKSPV